MWDNFRANIVHYLTFTAHLSPNGGEPFGIVWTVCVEEYFYLILPIAFWLFRPRGMAVLLMAIVALTCLPQLEVLPGTDGFGTWFLIPVNLLTGAVLAAFRPKQRGGWFWIGVVALAGVLVNGVTGWFHPFGLVMGLTTTLVVWAFATTPVGVPAALKLTTAAGKWSYSIYLFHLPFCSAALLVCRLCGLDRLGTIGYFAAATILATIGTTALAGIVYTIWERPILARRKWVTERRWPRTLASSCAQAATSAPATVLPVARTGSGYRSLASTPTAITTG
jgi:peptidoglycan/LPS O-acetylase OafA/YrhL